MNHGTPKPSFRHNIEGQHNKCRLARLVPITRPITDNMDGIIMHRQAMLAPHRRITKYRNTHRRWRVLCKGSIKT